ncbi:DNA mismatch repair protein MutT [Massilia eurypsychrophila]|jgi:ADP-ribose pyrophosphatase YjhB (NUDIX family)|uniref:DNA mismatch repair protein MutT n=1 Tax=Massilia eurypsychrophila TaxID=1485217 RepID=A0A2G8TK02_9BURK|nr:NUDIX domain-containing protein [Massilia eurypsychrophila]PIL46380.1 DNA mismatch repair protein MutT [Massilia eurypsychrophila]
MPLLQTFIHPEVVPGQGQVLERQAARAIVLSGREVLLLYTRRYDDYSLPGGGVDANESIEEALRRELGEETGAHDVSIGRFVGYIDEHRPPRKAGYDVLFMRSHCYLCDAATALGKTAPENYEVANGMVPVWIDIATAIQHNEQILFNRPATMGLSVERETWLLHYIARELMGRPLGPNVTVAPLANAPF